MQTKFQRLMVLVAALVVCAGCGSGFYSHEIEVMIEPEPGGMPVRAFQVGMSDNASKREDINKIELHSPDSNGVVRIERRELSTLWAWQKRPEYVLFELYIPSVSTNGAFCFRFDQGSRLPWRGLKRGRVDVRPKYFEFERRIEGWRQLSTVRTEVLPSALGGYRIKLHLPIRALREGVDAKFIPYHPK